MYFKKYVEKEDAEVRLDKILAKYFNQFSRSYIKYLIDNHRVKVNNKEEKPSFNLKEGDFIMLNTFKQEQYLKSKIKLKIIYQDNDLLVIDKQAGLSAHPNEKSLKLREEVTLLDILVRDFPKIKKMEGKRPGIVHRLDKETSGLMIVALNKKSYEVLKKQFQAREVKKIYKSLLLGRLKPREGAIEASIGRSYKDRSKMSVVGRNEGKAAITEYKAVEYLLGNNNSYSLLDIYPITGRTHQIRVHFSSIGHPVVGDKIYGKKRKINGLNRQFLHAYSIEFTLPSGRRRKFKSELPEDLKSFLNKLAIAE